MYDGGYVYFRFDRRYLEFLSDIGVCYHRQKPPCSSLNKKPNIQRYFIQPYHVYQVSLLLATILLILDEFDQSSCKYDVMPYEVT